MDVAHPRIVFIEKEKEWQGCFQNVGGRADLVLELISAENVCSSSRHRLYSVSVISEPEWLKYERVQITGNFF